MLLIHISSQNSHAPHTYLCVLQRLGLPQDSDVNDFIFGLLNRRKQGKKEQISNGCQSLRHLDLSFPRYHCSGGSVSFQNTFKLWATCFLAPFWWGVPSLPLFVITLLEDREWQVEKGRGSHKVAGGAFLTYHSVPYLRKSIVHFLKVSGDHTASQMEYLQPSRRCPGEIKHSHENAEGETRAFHLVPESGDHRS